MVARPVFVWWFACNVWQHLAGRVIGVVQQSAVVSSVSSLRQEGQGEVSDGFAAPVAQLDRAPASEAGSASSNLAGGANNVSSAKWCMLDF